MVATRRLTSLAAPAVEAFRSLPAGGIVIALSGGADSAAAAWASVSAGRLTRAVHVHHGLRFGDRMAEAAEAVAADLGLELTVSAVSVPTGASFESQARKVRLERLEEERRPDEWIVTAHTRDDQVETMLMRLVRGTGLDGLAGIERARGPYLRPMLGLTRSETREIATLAGLAWRDDPENLDVGHLRNRVRNDLLPSLTATFGTGPSESLARMAALVGDDLEVLRVAAAAVPVRRRPGEVRLATGGLAAVHRAVASRAIRDAFLWLHPPHPPSSAVVERVMELVRGVGGPFEVGPLRLARTGAWVVVSNPSIADPPGAVDLAVPGSVTWGGLRIDVTVSQRPVVVPLTPLVLVMPLGDVDRLTIRAARPTDMISIGAGHKRVFDALAEASVAAPDRPGYPVVSAGGTVVWIPGVRRAVWAGKPDERYLWAVATEDAQWQRYER